ncbi:antitoxin Xre-like helix-turn-helix domain-containing protein [Falsiroseomonas sp. HC035]|uniref:antitoxin Xre-like helix-turn-helix domain-containing protein n=1 Tax=Falsiroseomonas sp. HC035 TaxID=3390999 RepID=UPI003D315FCA
MLHPSALNEADQAQSEGPPRLDPSRFSSENRRRLSAPGLRTFLAIADLWRLTEEERRLVLGLPSPSTFRNWCKTVREHRDLTLDVDVLTRISAVLGIHQALQILHPDEHSGIAWLRGPHRSVSFGGQPPMSHVTSGTQDGLLVVRRFLDAACGGLYMEPNEVDRGGGEHLRDDLSEPTTG